MVVYLLFRTLVFYQKVHIPRVFPNFCSDNFYFDKFQVKCHLFSYPENQNSTLQILEARKGCNFGSSYIQGG